MENQPKPIPLAMIFCEMVINDLKTGNRSLISSFNRINSDKIPCVYPKFNIFLMLTGGVGDYSIKIDCVSDKAQKIVELSAPIRFGEQNQIIELDFELRGVNFPDYGRYGFNFYLNNEVLISRYMEISPIEQKKEESR